jgi:hypothetical protein
LGNLNFIFDFDFAETDFVDYRSNYLGEYETLLADNQGSIHIVSLETKPGAGIFAGREVLPIFCAGGAAGFCCDPKFVVTTPASGGVGKSI